MAKPLVLTPRAARWLYLLVHTPGLGIGVDDRHAATEAIDAIEAHVKGLGPPPAPPPEKPGDGQGRK